VADQKDISAAPAAPAAPASGGTQSFGGDRPSRGYSEGGRGRGPRRSSRDQRESDEPKDGLIEKVVHINRSSKVVKGGRRFSFTALVVVGDGEGKIGVGLGKANEVPDAIRKSTEHAKKRLISVKIKGDTIPHEVFGVFDGGKVLLKPASTGTGLIAGGGVRAVLEAAGVKNVLTKSMGSNNHIAVVNATIAALRQLRLSEDIAAVRKA